MDFHKLRVYCYSRLEFRITKSDRKKGFVIYTTTKLHPLDRTNQNLKENSKFMYGRKNIKKSQVNLENATTELHPLDSTVSSRTTVKITGAK